MKKTLFVVLALLASLSVDSAFAGIKVPLETGVLVRERNLLYWLLPHLNSKVATAVQSIGDQDVAAFKIFEGKTVEVELLFNTKLYVPEQYGYNVYYTLYQSEFGGGKMTHPPLVGGYYVIDVSASPYRERYVAKDSYYQGKEIKFGSDDHPKLIYAAYRTRESQKWTGKLVTELLSNGQYGVALMDYKKTLISLSSKLNDKNAVLLIRSLE